MNNSRDLNELIGMLEGREVPCQPDQTIALFLHDHTLNYVFQNVTKRFPRPISVPITTSWDSTPNAETFMTPDNVLIHTIFIGPDIVSDMSANVPFTVHVGSRAYPDIERVLLLCSMHTATTIRVDMNMIDPETVVNFSYRLHPFSRNIRQNIIRAMNPNSIRDGPNYYTYGMMGREQA